MTVQVCNKYCTRLAVISSGGDGDINLLGIRIKLADENNEVLLWGTNLKLSIADDNCDFILA